MEVPSWATSDTITLCTHVQQYGKSSWDIAAAALKVSPALCSLKWQVLYLAHQPESLPQGCWIYWELGVLLRGRPAPDNTTTVSKRSRHKALAEWLPGRTAYGAKQAEIKYLNLNKRKTLARLAKCPATLLGVLETWPGPRPELHKFKHTLLPDHIVAAHILAELVPCSPALKDAALLPAAEPSNTPQTPANREVPVARAIGNTPVLVLNSATETGSNRSSPHTVGLVYPAPQSAMLYAPECNSSSGSTLAASRSTPSSASFFPYGVFGTGGGCSFNSSLAAPALVSATSNLGQSFSSPVAGAADTVGACGVDLGSTPIQLQPSAAISNSASSKYKKPRAERSRLSNSSSPCSSTAANLGHGFPLPGAVAAIDVGAFVGDWRSPSSQAQPFGADDAGQVSNYSVPSNSAATSVDYGSTPPAADAAVDIGAWVEFWTSSTRQAASSNKSPSSNYDVGHGFLLPTANAAINGCAFGYDLGSPAAQLQSVAASTKMTSSSCDVGHGFLSPSADASVDDGSFGSDRWSPTVQLQPGAAANKCRSSNYKGSHATAVKSGSKAATQSSEDIKHLPSKQQQRQVVRKRKASGYLVPAISSAAAAAGAAAEVGSQQQPAKVQCGSGRSRAPAVVEQQQQQDTPLELQSWQSWPNQLKAAEEAFSSMQHIVPLDLPGQTPSQHCNMETEDAAAADLQAAAGQDTFTADQLSSFLDQLLGQTPERLAGQHAVAAPGAAGSPMNVQRQQPRQPQQQGASNVSAADLAAQAAADDICGCFTDADLAAMYGLPAVHQAAVAAPPPPPPAAAAAAAESANVQGRQQQGAGWDIFDLPTEEEGMAAICEQCAEPQALEPQHQCQHQPAAVQDDTYADVAEKDLQYTFEGEQLATLASMVSWGHFSEEYCDTWMQDV